MSNIEALKHIPEVSFIDGATLESVKNEFFADYAAKYQELTGIAAKLTDADPIRLVLLATANLIYQDMRYIDRSGKQDLLKYSYGDFLDNLGAMKRVERRAATYATVRMRFSVTAARGENTPIPGGTRVATESGLYFLTDAYTEIPAGQTAVELDATALRAGRESNALPEGSISKIVDPVPYIAAVTNIAPSVGGADIESDDDFTERIYLAPSGYSVAGPKDAYEYHAKQFRADVLDAKAFSPSPSVVKLLFLLDGGILPTEEEQRAMEAYLSDKTLRPTADRVLAAAPQEQEYSIALTYFINASDSAQAVTIQTAVQKAITEYKQWQRKLGRDVNPSELIKRVVLAGAKRVELTQPPHIVIEDTKIAKLAAETIQYGGLEDD